MSHGRLLVPSVRFSPAPGGKAAFGDRLPLKEEEVSCQRGMVSRGRIDLSTDMATESGSAGPG
jgi:hypothetical protein